MNYHSSQIRFNWLWCAVSFGILTVFHLLPITVIRLFSLGTEGSPNTLQLESLIFLFAWLAIVAVYIGHASGGRLLEHALASAVYLIVLSRVIPVPPLIFQNQPLLRPFIGIALLMVISALGGYVGGHIYEYRAARNLASSSAQAVKDTP